MVNIDFGTRSLFSVHYRRFLFSPRFRIAFKGIYKSVRAITSAQVMTEQNVTPKKKINRRAKK